MLLHNPLLKTSFNLVRYIKCVSYFGFAVFFLVNIGFLISEYIKAKQKKITFKSKFQELNSLKTSKEIISIVLDSLIYSIHLMTFIISYLFGIL